MGGFLAQLPSVIFPMMCSLAWTTIPIWEPAVQV